jgi:antitoxin ParD1/3/4
MQPIERMSITLPADMARMIRAKVEEGRYASNSEVIREALRAWQQQEQLHAERLAAIRAAIADSLADPRPPLTLEEVDRRLEEMFAAQGGKPADDA